MKRFEAIAIHEAGHAVIAEILCLNPEYVTVEPNKKHDGHLKRRSVSSPIDRWRGLICDAAGYIAQELHGDRRAWWELTIRDDGDTDGAKMRSAIAEHSGDRDQQAEWFDLVTKQSRKILKNPAVWRSVESLAVRLMEKRTIDYVEASEVIEAMLGRSKWNREQFQMSNRYAAPPQTWFDSREEYQAIGMAFAAMKGGAAK
ncbi:MAG TPA: hypothetical protein VJ810_23665 [Blastocatellia bacterium]|nr:hypothetical protein [Blastocatellia bacterium]